MFYVYAAIAWLSLASLFGVVIGKSIKNAYGDEE
jgi:hypothetical protein